MIALGLLGDTIDVQGGGNDLLFPHHECSAAHAEVLTGAAPFAGHYVHAGMIGLRRREDVQVHAATWSSSPGCAPTASTRWRCGWR